MHVSFSDFGPLSVSREGRRSFASTQPLTYFSFFCLLSSSPPCITFLLHFPPVFHPVFPPLAPLPSPFISQAHRPLYFSISLLDKKTLAPPPPLFLQGAAEFGPPLQPYMVKCRPLHQVVPKREEEERKRLGRWRKTGEEAATGDALHRTRCPHHAPRPRRGLRVVVNLQKHGRFGRAFWGRTGMSGRGVAVWLRGGGFSPSAVFTLEA